MKYFTIYNAQGKILRSGSCPDEMFSIQALAGESVVEGSGNSFTQYVANGAIANKLPNPASLNGMTITNAPLPSTITINGQSYDVTESTIELDFTDIGHYQISIDAVAYMSTSFEVVV